MMLRGNVRFLNNRVVDMASKVKIVTNKPGPAPKAVEVGKLQDVKVPETLTKMTARGMGAAVKGGSYMGYK
jgi:hypothetical protein